MAPVFYEMLKFMVGFDAISITDHLNFGLTKRWSRLFDSVFAQDVSQELI
jgi:hypothetical protein